MNSKLSPWAKPFMIHGTCCAEGVNKSDSLSSTFTMLEDNEVVVHGELENVNCSYSKLNEDDPDVDSPCWKGLQTNNQTKLKNIELPTSLHLASEQKTCKRLNPFAPLFFPRNIKQRRVDQVSAPLDPSKQEVGILNTRNSSSYYTYYGSSMSESCCGGSSNGSNDGADYAMPLCATPRSNIEMMIGKISELSNLLLQQCLRDSDPLNVAELDSIKHTIGDLTTCIIHSAQHTSFINSDEFRQEDCWHSCSEGWHNCSEG